MAIRLFAFSGLTAVHFDRRIHLSVERLWVNSALICRHSGSGGFGGAPKPHHCMNYSPETEND